MCGLAGSAVAAAAVVFNLAPAWSLPSWLLAMVALTAFVVLGLLSARAPVSTWLALVESPRFLIFKALTYARIAAGLDPLRWDRSARDTTGPGPLQQRVEVAGVPIDRVDMAAAMDGLRETLANGRHVQVATVNLDFLVRAQRDPALMDVLRQTELNVADGMPVVWLSRLMGHGVPERVAGADLVPYLVREAAASGKSVFLLGGQDGAAEASVRRLRQELPQLVVAGWHEPPATRLEDMNHEQLVRMINDSGADVLLVALGNPKQELWIARNRRHLPGVKVAIGVGCVFDIWSERVERAPAWMQRSGLEWLHRFIREPRRLAGRFVTDAAWLPMLAARAFVGRARPETTPRSAPVR
jgi:N-acetylglucosaminyldiphosphoundecaprenol N-acetyl-beta-D-mannosaminyltransferase